LANLFEGACPNFLHIKKKKNLLYANGNFEEQNKVLESSPIIINYGIIIIIII